MVDYSSYLEHAPQVVSNFWGQFTKRPFYCASYRSNYLPQPSDLMRS